MASLRENLAQLLMVGVAGEELSAEERSLLKEHRFGGFILFSHNLKEPRQILALCRSLWETGGEFPPFIAVDQEGGRVQRMPPPFTQFPPAADVGRTGSAELAYRAALAAAGELRAVGVNLNFAPVFDVHSNPANPVIGDRALSSDPREVIRLGWEVVRGLREGGVIPCVKHFPGHGDTAQDSHLELPVVRKEFDELQATELEPFVYACQKRVEALMTAHVLYPALDPKYPATLSRAIVGDYLRAELRYDGVVFGDDLEMKAVSDNYSVEQTAELGLAAGIDVLMFSHESARAAAALEFLCREVEKNPELGDRASESQRRIRKLKKRTLNRFSGAREEELGALIGAPNRGLAAEIQGSR